MNNKPDGGPAYPQAIRSENTGMPIDVLAGMSLRDYFAAQALHLVELAEVTDGDDINEVSNDCIVKALGYARAAYRIADQMLKERLK